MLGCGEVLGKSVKVCWGVRQVRREVWGKSEERCGEVLGKMWGSVLGCGGGQERCGQCWEGMGKFVGVREVLE